MKHDFDPLSERCRGCGMTRWLLVELLALLGLGLEGSRCSPVPTTRTQ